MRKRSTDSFVSDDPHVYELGCVDQKYCAEKNNFATIVNE